MTQVLLQGEAFEQTLKRMAHEMAALISPGHDWVLLGIQRGGVGLAFRLASRMEAILGWGVPVGTLDVTMHRDDLDWHRIPEIRPTEIPCDLTARTAVLVDDVLFHGRTIRAALDALHALGRPRRVQLAVLVDRGHRELPIQPDFTGLKIETSDRQRVVVRWGAEPLQDEVWLTETPST